jgi:hypothetical protein
MTNAEHDAPEISSATLANISLTLVQDGLGDITREQYEDAINHIIPAAYDVDHSAFISINWEDVGSTKIVLEFEGFNHSSHTYEQGKAYDRECEYIGELLEKSYTYACENA